jgi:UDP-3-O-[3-hydroxymyristoyl] N-acetylglucosamine deacetylase
MLQQQQSNPMNGLTAVNGMTIKQRTLRNAIHARGPGLHSGENVSLSLKPAPINTGIVFRRIDLDPVVEILARAENVGETLLSTSLKKDHVKIATIEHLMSALAGLGIDNLYVELNKAEVPIMDGSANPFVFMLQSGGVVEQDALKRFIRIKKRLEIIENDKRVALEPYDGFRVKFQIQFDHPLFNEQNQCAFLEFSTTAFVKAIARARTFGFLSEYEQLKAQNLALGGSHHNVIVIDDTQVLNENGLRYADEFVKHKILDAIGDLYLLGAPLLGQFEGVKSGHRLNNMLLRSLLASPDSWEYVTFEDATDVPLFYLPVQEDREAA